MYERKLYKKECNQCKTDFTGRSISTFCSKTCRQKFYKLKNNQVAEFKGLSTSTTGALNEYRVAIDLLSKGYEVFRSMSPNCTCDIVIRKVGILQTLEVKTGYKLPSGVLVHPKPIYKTDILAVVSRGGVITYNKEI